jgi:hypothetical protein
LLVLLLAGPVGVYEEGLGSVHHLVIYAAVAGCGAALDLGHVMGRPHRATIGVGVSGELLDGKVAPASPKRPQ